MSSETEYTARKNRLWLYTVLYYFLLVFGMSVTGYSIYYAQFREDAHSDQIKFCREKMKEPILNKEGPVHHCDHLAKSSEDYFHWAFNRGWDEAYYKAWLEKMGIIFLSLLGFIPVIILKRFRKIFE